MTCSLLSSPNWDKMYPIAEPDASQARIKGF